eukprot:133129-Prorocentrum_minimum.AAC.1
MLLQATATKSAVGPLTIAQQISTEKQVKDSEATVDDFVKQDADVATVTSAKHQLKQLQAK